MSISGLTTRQKLLRAALELFAVQGISGTTTRQIAELAGVNEVTLFRQFGHKYGLLQAIVEESGVLSQLAAGVQAQVETAGEFLPTLRAYAGTYLTAFAEMPELIRSLIGEAGQFSPENRRALGHGWMELNASLTNHLEVLLRQEQLDFGLPSEQVVNLLLSLVLGYAVVELTCETHPICPDRQQFLTYLERLFQIGCIPIAAAAHGVVTPIQGMPLAPAVAIDDLPAPLVHTILQRARKCSLQDYALAYVLFGAGLSGSEVLHLQRSQLVSGANQHLLQVVTVSDSGGNSPQPALTRQVPVNQWILGQRYGSHSSNPLSRWLRSRRDSQQAMFIQPATGESLTLENLEHQWQTWTAGLVTPIGQPPLLPQSQQTWRVEMLSRGMSQENLSLLTGLSLSELQPYVQRSREKLALEQAARLDRKPGASKPKGVANAEE